MRTVAIIEGFSGGPRHTAEFRQALVQAGFRVIKKAKEADIVFAHSAGIYAVPTNTKASLVILVAPTYWPGRRLIKRSAHFTAQGRKYYVSSYGWRFYLWKKCWEIYYFFARHKYLWLGIWHNNKLDYLQKVADGNRKVVFIRNTQDAFTTPTFRQEISQWKNVKYLELPGIHDDFTKNPWPYVELIKREAK